MERTYLRIILIFFILVLSSCGGGDDPPNPTTDTISPNPTTSSSSSELVRCNSNSERWCIEITLRCTDGNVGWFDQKCGSEAIQIPHGRPVYALLVSGFAQNKNLNMFHWYNFARCLHEKNAYIHYAWWNNLLAPYMEKPLHNPASIPSTLDHPRHDTDGQNNVLTWSVLGYPIFKVPGTEPFPTKAIPAEDHQFQADAEIMLKAIRKYNPKAAIILVGHSMGGDAIMRLASNPNLTDQEGKKIDIALLAPIDPVGNRTCLPTATNNPIPYCSGNDHFWRYQTAREDFSRAWGWGQVPKRQFGTNIKYLYHRYQREALPPFWDWGTHQYFDYSSATRKPNIIDDSTNIQAEVEMDWRSGEDLHSSLGGPNYGGGLDGHGEIVGFRGANLSFDKDEWLFVLQSSHPLALDAQNWPYGGGCPYMDDLDAARKCRVYHLTNWENYPSYLDDNGLAPLSPVEHWPNYCNEAVRQALIPKNQNGEVMEGVVEEDYCTYCMVSGDLCSILRTKVDIPLNSAPVADAGPDQTVECSAPIGTEVSLDGSGSSDPDGDPLIFTWDWQGGNTTTKDNTVIMSFPLGTQTVTLTVSDGNLTDTDTVDITVRDTTAPTLSVSLSPNVLWPPNHKQVTITASIDVNDTCDDSPTIKLVSIISNEPDNGMGDGDTSNDIQGAEFGTDDREFLLRAERSGHGTDRIYTVTYSVTDSSGNVTEATAKITVPHDHGKSK